MFAELYVMNGRDAGKGLTATPGPSIYMGRAATNQLRIRDSLASRVHCRIDVTADGLTLHDNQSGNGTFVNGEKVQVLRRLEDGDTIQLGSTSVRVLIETEVDRERWGSAAPGGDEGARTIRLAPRDNAAEDARASGESSPSASEVSESLSETWSGDLPLAAPAAEDTDELTVSPAPAAPPRPRPASAPPTVLMEGASGAARARDLTPATGRRALREVLPGYVLEARLGGRHREGMAVYRARQTSLDRVVAVRVLVSRPDLTVDPLLREARAIARLPHPHVVTIHDLIQRGSIHALVMEFLGGGSLQDRLEDGPLGLAEALTLGEAVAAALAYGHEHGVVHRSVRPSNILFAPEVECWKLCDFGAATGPTTPRVGDTTFLSTPLPGFGFLAPEQLVADHSPDPRTDVYGLGATLYACLSGGPPFSGRSAAAIGGAIFRDPPPPLRGVPDSLAHLIARCLAKDPDERWSDGRALQHELGACRAALSSLEEG